MKQRTSFSLASWLRLVALSLLLGLALLAGNVLSIETAHAQSFNAAITCPKITGFTPTSGSIGSSVTITGCGFTGATKVTFKGVSATFAVNSDTQITATVPNGATTGIIAVTTANGTIVKSASKFIVLAPPPAVTLSPTAGPPTSTVSVSGSNFGSYEAVDIYFDTTDEALAAANVQGAFSGINIPVPASAVPGTHWVTAVGRHSGLSAQAAFTVQTNWAEFGDVAQHTGVNPYENVLNPSNVTDLDLDWSAPTGAGIDSSSAVANGVVYVGSEDHNLYAFNVQTGAEVWSAPTSFYIDSSPAVANGVVYVGSTDSNLYAFNAQTGAQLWKAPTGSYISTSSPAVANGVVYVGSTDSNLYAFNAQTGAQLWKAPTGSYIDSSPAVAHGVVYVGSEDHNLYAFNAKTGVQLWKAPTGSYIDSSPAVANGVVYVGSDDDNLYAFNAQTGAQLWKAPTGNTILSSPAVANGVVYVGSDDGSLYAFNAQTGAQLWSAVTGGSIHSSPAVANGVVYVGSDDGSLYAYSLPPNDQLKPPTRPNVGSLHPNLKLHLQS